MRFFKGRKRRKEIERLVKFRQGKARIQQFIRKSNEAKRRYWKLGRKALELGDRAQFRQIAKAYLWTTKQIRQWERYLLMLETLEARRDQAASTTSFIESLQALSDSIMANADPGDLAKMQEKMEEALQRAATMEETLEAVMDSSADVIFPEVEESDEEIAGIERMMAKEIEEGAEGTLDEQIERGIEELEKAMRAERETKS